MTPIEPEQPLTEADKLLLICFVDDAAVARIDSILQTSDLRLLFRIQCITPFQMTSKGKEITHTIADATDPRRQNKKLVILLQFSSFPDMLMSNLAQLFFETTYGILPPHRVIGDTPDMDDHLLIKTVNRSIFTAIDHYDLP